jgi:hypothetical protein
MTTFYCLRFEIPKLEGQVPVFISPRNRVVRLYPQALGSLSFAAYVSQGYGGGIRIRLHTGYLGKLLSGNLAIVKKNCAAKIAFFKIRVLKRFQLTSTSIDIIR